MGLDGKFFESLAGSSDLIFFRKQTDDAEDGEFEREFGEVGAAEFVVGGEELAEDERE